MPKFTSAWDLARHEEATFEEVKRRAKSIHTGGVIKIAKDAAGQLLSGEITTKEFRAAGHPLAKRQASRRGFRRTRDPFRKGGQMSEKVRGRSAGSAVGFPKLPINEQKGALKRSMRIVGEVDAGRLLDEYGSAGSSGSQMLRIGFTEQYAAFVLRKGGTRLMVDRGYQAAFARIEKKRNTEMERDIRLMVLTVAARRSA